SRELAEQSLRELTISHPVEERTRSPVVRPRMGGTQFFRLIRVPRNHMSVQSRILVSENRVIDAGGTRQLQQRIPQPRYILEISGALLGTQSVECWHYGIRKQQRVTPQELPLSKNRPS